MVPFVFTWNTCVKRCVTSNTLQNLRQQWVLPVSTTQPSARPERSTSDNISEVNVKVRDFWEKSSVGPVGVTGFWWTSCFDRFWYLSFKYLLFKAFFVHGCFCCLPWRIRFSNSSCTATVPPMRDYRHLVMNKNVSCNKAVPSLYAWNINPRHNFISWGNKWHDFVFVLDPMNL